MKVQNSRCLVLNADYTALTIIDWKRAIVWSISDSVKDKIDVVDFYKDDYIAGVNDKKIPIPAVVRTMRYYRIHNQRVNFSRKNIFLRDDHMCQYCGLKKDTSELTYDHVIPKSLWKQNNMGSPTNWTNIVTACIQCNRAKGNRTPKQASMPLKNLPISPTKSTKYLPVSHFLTKIRTDIPHEWKLYLPESYTYTI
jgi:5-methylcytosine-specific restriction endonuclease McrA